MGSTHSVSVLVSIINWNNSAATHACLESIAQIDKPGQPDIYLIDNNSQIEHFKLNDETLKKLRSVRFVKNTRNLGFAGGHNLAIKYALNNKYDYICLLNNDATILSADIFKKLASALAKDPTAIAAAPTILSQINPDVVWFAGGVMNPRTTFVSHKHVNETTSVLGALDNVTYSSFLTGCCLMISMKRFPGVQKCMDESFFLYWEDADWCVNALSAGANLLYVKNAEVLHATSSSLGIRSANYAYYNIRNRLLFAKKWSSTKLTIFKCLWIGFKITGLSLKHPSKTPKVFWYILRALFDGLKGKTGAIS